MSLYNGCAPYPCGNHSSGLAISNLASVIAPFPLLNLDTEAVDGEILSPEGEVNVKTTSLHGPSTSAVAVTTTSCRLEGTSIVKWSSAMRLVYDSR